MRNLLIASLLVPTFGLCSLAVACSSTSTNEPTTPTSTATDGGAVDAPTATSTATATATSTADAGPATWTEVYTTVIQPTCPSCHSGTPSSGDLDMSTQETAYTNLVGVKAAGPACGSSGETRVVAGNASESLIWQKTTETKPPCGSQMPLGKAPLSTTDTDMIESWINAGAENN